MYLCGVVVNMPNYEYVDQGLKRGLGGGPTANPAIHTLFRASW